MRAHRLWAGAALLTVAAVADPGGRAISVAGVGLLLILTSFSPREA